MTNFTIELCSSAASQYTSQLQPPVLPPSPFVAKHVPGIKTGIAEAGRSCGCGWSRSSVGLCGSPCECKKTFLGIPSGNSSGCYEFWEDGPTGITCSLAAGNKMYREQIMYGARCVTHSWIRKGQLGSPKLAKSAFWFALDAYKLYIVNKVAL